VRPAKVVFDEPLCQTPVELRGIGRHLAKTQELIVEGPVEPLVQGVVLRPLHARPVMHETEILTGSLEVFVEFASVVSLDILDFAVKEDMEPVA
jgi:hypothetical protein